MPTDICAFYRISHCFKTFCSPPALQDIVLLLRRYVSSDTEMWLEIMGQFKTLCPSTFEEITGRRVKLFCQLDLRRAQC